MNDEMNKFSQGLIAKYEPIEISQEILDKLNEIGLPNDISKEELKKYLIL